jgi:hypothetical protein
MAVYFGKVGDIVFGHTSACSVDGVWRESGFDVVRSDGDGFCVFIHPYSNQYFTLNSINQSDD